MMEENEISDLERMESVVSSYKQQLKELTTNLSSSPDSVSVSRSSKSIIDYIESKSADDGFLNVHGNDATAENRFHKSTDAGGGCCIIA